VWFRNWWIVFGTGIFFVREINDSFFALRLLLTMIMLDDGEVSRRGGY
jgi:hypothetical protein